MVSRVLSRASWAFRADEHRLRRMIAFVATLSLLATARAGSGELWHRGRCSGVCGSLFGFAAWEIGSGATDCGTAYSSPTYYGGGSPAVQSTGAYGIPGYTTYADVNFVYSNGMAFCLMQYALQSLTAVGMVSFVHFKNEKKLWFSSLGQSSTTGIYDNRYGVNGGTSGSDFTSGLWAQMDYSAVMLGSSDGIAQVDATHDTIFVRTTNGKLIAHTGMAYRTDGGSHLGWRGYTYSTSTAAQKAYATGQPDGTFISKISTGGMHGMALMNDGSVYLWGRPYSDSYAFGMGQPGSVSQQGCYDETVTSHRWPKLTQPAGETFVDVCACGGKKPGDTSGVATQPIGSMVVTASGKVFVAGTNSNANWGSGAGRWFGHSATGEIQTFTEPDSAPAGKTWKHCACVGTGATTKYDYLSWIATDTELYTVGNAASEGMAALDTYTQVTIPSIGSRTIDYIVAETHMFSSDYWGCGSTLVIKLNDGTLMLSGNNRWDQIESTNGHGAYYLLAYQPTTDSVISASAGAEHVIYVTGCQPGYGPSGGVCVACNQGEYSDGFSACAPCAPGYWQNQTLQSTCNACPSGSANPNTGSTTFDCTTCLAGTYAAAGSASCTSCPAGTFGTTPGRASVTEACQDCAVGTYSDQVGQQSCIDCPKGEYTDETGQMSCIPCVGGASTKRDRSTKSLECICPSGTYGAPMISSSLNCTACDSSVSCTDENYYPQATEAMWIGIPELGTIEWKTYPVVAEEDMPATITPYSRWALNCIPTTACPGGVNYCEEGYVGDGCTTCADTYYRVTKSRCKKCETSSIDFSIVIAVVIPLFVLGSCGVSMLYVFLGTFNELFGNPQAVVSKAKKKYNAWVKCLKMSFFLLRSILKFLACKLTFNPLFAVVIGRMVKYFQLVSLVMNIQLSDWPLIVRAMTDWMDVFNFEAEEYVQTGCVNDGSSFTRGFWFYFKLAAPLMLLVVGGFSIFVGFFVHWVVMCARFGTLRPRGEAREKTRARYSNQGANTTIRTVLKSYNFLYVILHATTVYIFTCFEQSPGVYRLTGEPSIECFVGGGEWIQYAPIAGACVFIYSLGLPATFLSIAYIYGHPNRSKSVSTNARYGWLWKPFRGEYYYWMTVDMLQKFFLGLGLMFTIFSSKDQANYMTFVSIFFFGLHLYVWPYKLFIPNFLEFNVTLGVQITILCGLMFSSGGVSPVGETAIIYLLGGVHLYIWISFFFCLVHATGICGLPGILCRVAKKVSNGSFSPRNPDAKVSPAKEGIPALPNLTKELGGFDDLKGEMSEMFKHPPRWEKVNVESSFFSGDDSDTEKGLRNSFNSTSTHDIGNFFRESNSHCAKKAAWMDGGSNTDVKTIEMQKDGTAPLEKEAHPFSKPATVTDFVESRPGSSGSDGSTAPVSDADASATEGEGATVGGDVVVDDDFSDDDDW